MTACPRISIARLGRGLATLPAAAVLLTAAPRSLLAQGGEGAAAPGLFTLNLGVSLWTVVIFLGLLAILWKFAWGPILGTVEARERNIQGALDEAARQRAEAERLLAEHRAQMADARRQAREILDESRAAGDRLKKEIEEKARTEGQAIIERAKKEIERERDQAIEALRREAVDLAMAAASRLMRQRLDEVADRRLVIESIEEMTRAQDAGAARPGGGA